MVKNLGTTKAKSKFTNISIKKIKKNKNYIEKKNILN